MTTQAIYTMKKHNIVKGFQGIGSSNQKCIRSSIIWSQWLEYKFCMLHIMHKSCTLYMLCCTSMLHNKRAEGLNQSVIVNILTLDNCI